MGYATSLNPEVAERRLKGNQRKSAIFTTLLAALLLVTLLVLGFYQPNQEPKPEHNFVAIGTMEANLNEDAASAAAPGTSTAAIAPSVGTPVNSQTVSTVTQTVEDAPTIAASTSNTATITPPLLPGFMGFQNHTPTNGNNTGTDDFAGKPGGTGINPNGGTNDNSDGVLDGRSPIFKERPLAKNDVSGTVRVKITVNSKGKVIKAIYSAEGSTSNDAYLKQLSIEAAQKWEWSADSQNRPEQMGFIDFKYAAQ